MGRKLAAIKQCKGCKEYFPREQLVDYCSSRAKTLQSYCPKCLAERQEKDYFIDTICEIFNIPKMDAKLNNQYKKLRELGYTNQTIIDCLRYVYDIKKIDKKVATLFFVNDENLKEMMDYKRKKQINSEEMIEAIKQTHEVYYPPVRENNSTKKEEEEFDFDSFFK